MIMGAHAVIKHAPSQGVTLRKATDGQGVSLSKIGDAPRVHTPRLYLPLAPYGASLITVNLVKGDGRCDGCFGYALYVAQDGHYPTVMCRTHAHRWGVVR